MMQIVGPYQVCLVRFLLHGSRCSHGVSQAALSVFTLAASALTASVVNDLPRSNYKELFSNLINGRNAIKVFMEVAA
jgi:hypothetical protein